MEANYLTELLFPWDPEKPRRRSLSSLDVELGQHLAEVILAFQATANEINEEDGSFDLDTHDFSAVIDFQRIVSSDSLRVGLWDCSFPESARDDRIYRWPRELARGSQLGFVACDALKFGPFCPLAWLSDKRMLEHALARDREHRALHEYKLADQYERLIYWPTGP